jgi:hypothetical protein
MPTSDTPVGVETTLKADDGIVIPRISLGETGFTGLRVINRHIIEEQQRVFRYPNFIKTVNEIRNNPTVGAAMNVYRMMISRVQWDVKPPVGATATDTARADAIRTMMHDMDHSWARFIEEVIPYLEYGFSVHEKVLRRRLRRKGSKFNDGLIGLKKLAPRSQDTIQGWLYSPNGGDELIGCEQTIRFMADPTTYFSKTDDHGLIAIDRDKFLLFSASSTKGNPEGNSIYKNIYLAYKTLTLLQDQELVGISKDIQGILKITIPPRYLAPDAPPEDKAAVAGFQAIIDNYNAGTQRGLLVPGMVDPESKLPLFTYDLMESKGSAKYDTESIIRRLQGDILSALSVDILKLGAEGSGSFSLAESKSSILAIAIDYRLREIREVLNQDLMRTLYEANGWSTEKMASFDYSDVEDVSVESMGKFIQQTFSVGAIEADRTVMNRVRKIMGVAELPEDAPVDKDKIPANMVAVPATSAGDGMKPGTTGNGTSKTAHGGKDPSAGNANNK